MALQQWRGPLARYGAPAAFLVAATVAALLIRAGLNGGDHHRAKTVTTVTQTLPHGAPVYYRIHAGDTLGTVAERFKTTVAVLRSLNPGIAPNSLQLGQKLRVR